MALAKATAVTRTIKLGAGIYVALGHILLLLDTQVITLNRI